MKTAWCLRQQMSLSIQCDIHCNSIQCIYQRSCVISCSGGFYMRTYLPRSRGNRQLNTRSLPPRHPSGVHTSCILCDSLLTGSSFDPCCEALSNPSNLLGSLLPHCLGFLWTIEFVQYQSTVYNSEFESLA